MTSSTPHSPAGASDAEAAEGRVYMVSGEDWDEIVAAANEAGDFQSGERIVINMGPQHPSTHGVLRLVLTLEGETVVEVRPSIGYLHTGIEKNMEYRTWTQGVTFCTRADYLMPIFTNAIGNDDAEHMRQTLFHPGNLTQPYHSINTDVHKRIRYLAETA